jgi:hypothetical protein
MMNEAISGTYPWSRDLVETRLGPGPGQKRTTVTAACNGPYSATSIHGSLREFTC